MFHEYPTAVKYVMDSWLSKFARYFVAAWTNDSMHFGNTTTNRVESAHAKLKRWLGASNCSFASSWAITHSLLGAEHTNVVASFKKSLNTVQHNYSPMLFKDLRGLVSRHALDMILEESKRAKTIGVDSRACKCVIIKTHGLPCAHQIAKFEIEGRSIPLSSIDSHWRKLDLDPLTRDDPKSISCKPDVDEFIRIYEEADDSKKIYLLQRLREITCPSTTYVLEPDVKDTNRGRPSKQQKKSHKKKYFSTRRDPSYFEIQASKVESVYKSSKAKKLKPIRNKLTELAQFRNITSVIAPKIPMHIADERHLISALKPELQSCIQYVKNQMGDGNCGFRAIADLMGFGADNWIMVRHNLIIEMKMHETHYRTMFQEGRYEELISMLQYFGENPSYENWMTMPDMGHIIASRYEVVLVYFSNQQCLTFLPLRSKPLPLLSRKLISIGFVNNNHFVSLYLYGGCPIPPIALYWGQYCYQTARGWELAYGDQIQRFKDMISPDVAVHEVFDID